MVSLMFLVAQSQRNLHRGRRSCFNSGSGNVFRVGSSRGDRRRRVYVLFGFKSLGGFDAACLLQCSAWEIVMVHLHGAP